MIMVLTERTKKGDEGEQAHNDDSPTFMMTSPDKPSTLSAWTGKLKARSLFKKKL